MSKKMRILRILIVFLLILFPFGEIFRFPLGNTVYLKPLDAVTVLLFFSTIIVYSQKRTFRNSFRWYFFLFPLIAFIALAVNSYWLRPNELVVSSLYLLRWISYMSIFFAVIQFDAVFKKKIVTFLLLDGLVILLIGYVQYFWYPNLRNLYYLGWDEHLYRMFSSFFDPNFLGAFFVLYLLFVLGLLFFNIQKFSRKQVLFYSMLSLLTVIAIFLTYSRSALIMLIVSGVIFFVLLQRKKFILLLLGAILLFVIIISPFFYIANINLFRVTSSIARIQSAQHTLQIIQDHPFIGVGFDSYRYAQIRYHFIKQHPQFPSHSGSGDDVSLLFVLATTGGAGLLAYCYLWFKLFRYARNQMKKNVFAIIFIASASGLFIDAFFNNSLFYAEIMFWMWMITGLLFGGKDY